MQNIAVVYTHTVSTKNMLIIAIILLSFIQIYMYIYFDDIPLSSFIVGNHPKHCILRKCAFLKQSTGYVCKWNRGINVHDVIIVSFCYIIAFNCVPVCHFFKQNLTHACDVNMTIFTVIHDYLWIWGTGYQKGGFILSLWNIWLLCLCFRVKVKKCLWTRLWLINLCTWNCPLIRMPRF